jgi:dihydrofolate reductase
MAGKVFFSVSMSLDGFVAPEERADVELWSKLTGWDMTDAGVQRWLGRWTELQQWKIATQFTQDNLGVGGEGEVGRDNDIARETFERTGATVLGRRMFDLGEQSWPEDAPYHTPVFVLTHEKRDPWERLGGTTFHFVNDGIETALDRARVAAGDRDVCVAGGGETILQYVNAGLVDEFSIALSPVLIGAGIRLFEGIDADRVALEQVGAETSPRATHLTYAVRARM